MTFWSVIGAWMTRRGRAQSEARFRSLTELSNDFFWETDAEHRYTAIELGRAYRGVRNNESKLGFTRWDIPYASPDAGAWAAHRAAIAARERFIDFRFSRIENGEERFYEHSGEPRYDARGKFLGYRGVGRDVTERLRAEEALRQSEGRYMRAVAAAEAGFWDWDVVQDKYYVSPRLLEMAGLPKDTIIAGREDFQARVPLHPDDLARWQQEIKALFASGGSRLSTELRVIVGGQTRWYRLDGMSFRDAAGRVVRWTGSSIDVTERKRVEEALRVSEERYARVMQAIEDGFWEWIVATDEFYASPRMLALYGLPPDTVFRGRADFLAQFPFHPQDMKSWREAVAAHLAGQSARVDIEVRAKVRAETRWIRVTAICQRHASGAEERWTGSVSDVTARRSTQEALGRSEERYERAMAAAEAGFWDWDVSKDEFYVSPRLLRMGGFPPGTTFAGRADFMRRAPFHPEDRDSWQQAVKALFASGGLRLAQVLRVIIGGETRWYRLDGMCFRDAAGQVVRWTGSSIDVTDRRLAEEALRASEERYARAMEATEAGHWEWDLVTHQVFHSPRFRELYGIRPDETFADRDAWKARQPVSASERERQERALQAAIADPAKTYDIELSFEIRPGEVRWLRSRAKVFRAEDGRPLRVTGATTDITPQKLAQEALRESQERYALAVAGSDDGVWDVDFAARRVFVSARGRELAGMPPGPETLPMEAFFAGLPLHPEDAERRNAAFEAHLKGEAPAYVGEFRLRQPDGSYCWRRLRGLCVRDANGKPLRMAGSISDIDARRRAEESRRVSEERYALAMQAAGDGHTDWNLATGEFYISPRLLEILGYAPDATFADRADWVRRFPFHPEDRPKWEAAITEHFAGREAKFRMDLRIVVNGETRWVAFTFIATRDASGKLVRWTGSIADINDAKLAEEARRLSEERYALAMRASGAGHWDWKITSDEFYASPRYLEFGGFPPDMKYSGRADVVSRIPFHPDDKAQYEAAVAAHFAGETPSVDMVIRVVPHGETRWLHVIGTCLRDAQGKPVRWAGSVTDITARKLAEEALRLSEKRYALAMEVADEGHFDWNVQTDEFFASARALSVFGAPPEAKYRTRTELMAHVRYHPDDEERLGNQWRTALDGTGVDHEFEFRILRGAAQEPRWIRSRWKIFRDEAGRALRVIGVITDITERKQAVETLRVNESRFRTLVELNSGGFWEQDENLRYTPSAFAHDITGYATDDRVGKTRWELCGDLTPLSHSWAEHQADLAARRPFRDFEYRRLRPDGTIGYYSTSGAPIFDDQGRFKGYYGVASDITDRKRAEEEVRESEARFRALTGISSDWYWRQDENLRFTYLSEGVSERAGWPGDDYIGRLRWEVAGIHLISCSWDEHKAVLAKRQPFRDLEYWRPGKDGRPVYSSISGAPIFDEQGNFKGYHGTGRNITERKRMEEELRQSEARFRSLTELSSDWYWEQDENLRFRYMSDQAPALGGYTEVSSIGKTRWELAGLRPLSCSWAEHQALLAARKPFRDLELARTMPDGSVVYLSISGEPIFDEQGAFRGYQGVGHSITERKRIEEELRSRQEMLELAQKSARAVAFEWNIGDQGPYRNHWSAELAVMYGLAPDDRDGSFERWKKLIHREDWPAVKAAIKHALRTGEVDTEYRVVHPDGAVHWLQAKGRMFFDAERKPRRMVGFMHDVTERKRVEEALRQSEERYALAVAGSNEGIFDWDLASDRVYVSHRAQELFGLARGELWRPRRDWRHILAFHPDDAPRLHDAIKAHIEGSAPTYDVEFRLIMPLGVRWYRQRGIALRDASGKAYRVVGSIGDVTEKHLTEEELRKLERKLRLAQRLEAMGTLAGGIAHDFNNILGAILGYGEMAQRDAPKGSRLARDLDSIVVAGERGRALVDRVLAFSRSSVGERVSVHVEKVVREALDLVSAKLPPDVTLHAKLHAGRAAMLGDATQVHQVLMNLASNAIQAMPSGGTLRVSLRPVRLETARAPTIGILDPGEYLVLEVADTGTGIAPEILDRIFDPFFTTKEVGTGTGLGLSLVHGIVSELGGAIDVASKPSAGSTFTVYLPRSGDAVDSPEREEHELPRGEGQRVLVVDDEEPLVKLATRTLQELGYAPVGFTSSSAALAAFRADPQRFDALITDERMPGMSGSVLIREVRGIRDRMPILLMSGYIGGAVASRAREAGAEEVLKKPLSARDLAASLARVLHS